MSGICIPTLTLPHSLFDFSRHCRASCLALAVAGLCLIHLPSFAQTQNNVTGYEVRYVIGLPLREVQISGNTQLSTSQLQATVRDFIGKQITASDVEEIRTRLTRAYVDAGYINSGAVFVMPGSLDKTDSISFNIIEGRLLEVKAQGLQGLHASYVQRRLPASTEVLNVNTLREQFQLLLQDPLFERIQSRLLPSGQLGEAVFELDVLRKTPYSFSIFANNYRSPAIGEAVLGASVVVRNLSGNGDALDAQIGKSDGAAPYHVAWTTPLPNPTQSLQWSWDQGRSNVVEAPLDVVDIHSKTSAIEMKWGQTWVNTLARRFETGLALSSKQTRSSLLGEYFSFSPGEINGRSKTQVFKLSQDWSERGDNFGFLGRSTFSFGRNNNLELDQTSGDSLIPPRQYFVWNGQLQWLRQLPQLHSQLLVRAQWQWSPSRLIPMEKMAVGGNASVRGYRESQLLRDQAQVLSVEFQRVILSDPQKSQQITALVFVDGGRAKNHAEQAQSLSSWGIGLKAQYAAWFADVTFAKRLHGPAGVGVSAKQSWQDQGVQLQLSYKFN